MPDTATAACLVCQASFTCMSRRHHVSTWHLSAVLLHENVLASCYGRKMSRTDQYSAALVQCRACGIVACNACSSGRYVFEADPIAQRVCDRECPSTPSAPPFDLGHTNLTQMLSSFPCCSLRPEVPRP